MEMEGERNGVKPCDRCVPKSSELSDGEKGPNEAAWWRFLGKDFISMGPHSVASLLAPGLLVWMGKRLQPKERFSCSECRSVGRGQEWCPAGM